MSSRTDYRFQLSPEEIDHISELTVQKLTELGTDKKDIVRLRLGIEELLLKLLNTSAGNEGVFGFYTKWGRPCLEIKIRGEQQEKSEEDEEFSEYSGRILENMGLKPETFHKNGWNYIRLKLKKKERSSLINIAVAAVLAGIVGFGATMLFPQCTELMSLIADPLQDTFLGLLTTIAGPMIFVSVVWGILCIGDAATLGTVGKKIVGHFILATFLMTMLAFLVGGLCFPLNFSRADMDYSQFSDVYALILNIFPSNIIAPFYENNTMQIIVIAIPFGLAVLILEQKAAVVADFTEQMNLIVQYLMRMITKLIPLFVFLSLLSMVLSGSLAKLVGCWKPLLLIFAVPMVVLILLIAVISAKYGVKIPLLVRKILPVFLIALATASSTAAFSSTMDACEKKLGIHRKITQFGVPLGMVIYMPVAAVLFSIVSLYMASVYDVSVSVSWLVIGILIASVLTIATPPIPGGSLTCYTIIFAQLGIPAAAVAAATIVDIITDFYCTAMDMVFIQLNLLLQADSMNMLERDVLKRET